MSALEAACVTRACDPFVLTVIALGASRMRVDHILHPSDFRNASSTTVNSAIFTGIVPTSGSNYSGGVENLPRILEDWSGDTFTYKGSMIVLFNSETATAKWLNTGSANNVYNAPIRNWSFDTQFLESSKLPPGTPSVRILSRMTWATTQ